VRRLTSSDPLVTVWDDRPPGLQRFIGVLLLAFAAWSGLGLLLSNLDGSPAPDERNTRIAMAILLAAACWALRRTTVTVDRGRGELRIRQSIGALGWTRAHPLSGFRAVIVDTRRHRRKRRLTIVEHVLASGDRRRVRLGTFSEGSARSRDTLPFARQIAQAAGWHFEEPRDEADNADGGTG
jgi:hypothetical protein